MLYYRLEAVKPTQLLFPFVCCFAVSFLIFIEFFFLLEFLLADSFPCFKNSGTPKPSKHLSQENDSDDLQTISKRLFQKISPLINSNQISRFY